MVASSVRCARDALPRTRVRRAGAAWPLSSPHQEHEGTRLRRSVATHEQGSTSSAAVVQPLRVDVGPHHGSCGQWRRLGRPSPLPRLQLPEGARNAVTCRWCGAGFTPAPMARGQVLCSRRCVEQERNQRVRQCACGWRFSAMSRHTVECAWCRASATGPLPTLPGGRACRVSYFTCRECLRLTASPSASRTICKSCAPHHSYVVVTPHPIQCRQCGATFIGKWRRLCDACSESNARRAHRSSRDRWKSLVRGRSYRVSDIYERDGWRCHLCGKVCTRGEKVPHPKAATIDHLVPIAAGGSDDPANVATAHFICNSKRGVGGVVQLRWAA